MFEESTEAQTQHDAQAERDARALQMIEDLQHIPAVALLNCLRNNMHGHDSEIGMWIAMWVAQK